MILRRSGATIFAKLAKEPERHCLVKFNNERWIASLEEKLKSLLSNYATTGFYIYDNHVIKIARKMKSSGRVELEIISIGQDYLQRGVLSVEITGRYFSWTDIINHGNLLEASHFVETIEHHQNHKNACLEEIAFKQGWPDLSTIEEVGLRFDKMVMGNTS